jgi:hypothetical protein
MKPGGLRAEEESGFQLFSYTGLLLSTSACLVEAIPYLDTARGKDDSAACEPLAIGGRPWHSWGEWA